MCSPSDCSSTCVKSQMVKSVKKTKQKIHHQLSYRHSKNVLVGKIDKFVMYFLKR